MNDKEWYAAEAVVAREAGEAIAYGLMEAGALGTETRDAGAQQLVTGYFDRQLDERAVRAALISALGLYGCVPAALRGLSVQAVPDRDWLAEWKKTWQPVETGRFLVAPPWIEPASASASVIVIKINPGMAFGTGTHETTRLCLKAIEKHFRGGSFLDVGTGTGILAIAAAKMFPDARIEAIDVDTEAIEIAKENALLNGVTGQIEFDAGSVTDETASADLVCANLTAPVILELLPQLLAATCGRLILSGILDAQLGMVQSRLIELGANVLESLQDGEWVALVI